MSKRVVRRPLAIGLPPALLATVCAAGAATGAPDRHERPEPSARVTGSAVLPDIPLARFSNGLLPGTVDRGVMLGGIGSDLYPAGRKGEFWTVTDRGLPTARSRSTERSGAPSRSRASTRRSSGSESKASTSRCCGPLCRPPAPAPPSLVCRTITDAPQEPGRRSGQGQGGAGEDRGRGCDGPGHARPDQRQRLRDDRRRRGLRRERPTGRQRHRHVGDAAEAAAPAARLTTLRPGGTGTRAPPCRRRRTLRRIPGPRARFRAPAVFRRPRDARTVGRARS